MTKTSVYVKDLNEAWIKHRNAKEFEKRKNTAMEYMGCLESAYTNGLVVAFKNGKHEVKKNEQI